jgi:hypothetical protein
MARVVTREVVLESDVGPTFSEGETHPEAVAIKSEDGKEDIDITNLTSDQLKALCKLLGVKGSSGKMKKWCVFTIGRLAVLKSFRDCSRSDTGHQQKRQHNSVVRLINVIFSEDFVGRLFVERFT